jgi:hypothetical protein
VEGFCEYRNEISGFIEFWEVFAQLASEEGDTPKKISKNKLKSNSIFVNSFCNIQYNTEPWVKDKLQCWTETKKQYRILHSITKNF